MKNTLVISLTLLVAAILPEASYAAESDQVFCAAIHPCNPDGTVSPEWDNDTVCGLRYAKECLAEKANASINECVDSQVTLEKRVQGLQLRNKKLRKMVRRLRRSQH